MNIKRSHAINGDLVSLRHPNASFEAPFTSHIDLAYAGVTHQALSMKSRAGISFEHTTGAFTVGDMNGWIIEAIDTVATQGSHRYQAVVEGDTGIISVHSYLRTDQLLALMGALRPSATRLGIVLSPDDDIEFASEPRLTLNTDLGILEISPLTADMNDQLPDWQGTAVSHGELFAGHLRSDAPYLALAGNTAVSTLMIADPSRADEAVGFLGELEVAWQS